MYAVAELMRMRLKIVFHSHTYAFVGVLHRELDILDSVGH